MFAVHVIVFKHRSDTLANMPGLPSLVQSWVSPLRDGVGDWEVYILVFSVLRKTRTR